MYYSVVRTAIKLIGIYIGLSVFLGLMWVILSYPNIPSTASQWLWMLVLAVPLQLGAEFLGELVSKSKLSRFVEKKTASKSFSVVRILYGVVLLLVFTGLLVGASYGWHILRS